MNGNHPPDDEARLVQLLRDDLPPARDPLFRIDVLARLERRRFRQRLRTVLTSGMVSGLGSLVSPLLARVARTVSRALVD